MSRLRAPLAASLLALLPGSLLAFTFPGIDGDVIDLSKYRGQPVLVVNTASHCGFTPQLTALQQLHETYGPQGLVVLAVPSDSFNQEFDSARDVQEFCEVQYGMTLPMTDILEVRGPDAHPFYAWLATQGAVPDWNFNKALIGTDGALMGFYRASTRPDSPRIVKQIRAMLP